jgi:hypothetical protein
MADSITPCHVAACDCISGHFSHCATLVPVSQYATLGLWYHSHSSLLKDLLLGVPLDEGACEQQAIQPP